MSIKWKKRRGLNPQAILDKIEGIKLVSRDGRVSYSGFDYHEAYASLFSMLEFPPIIKNELNIDSVVSKGLAQAARAGALTKDSVLKCLNDIARSNLSTCEKEFRLLTSLSMTGAIPFRHLNVESVRLRVIDGHYPKKYASRENVIRRHRTKFSLEHAGYTKIIASTKAKTIQGATSKALNALDLVRAVLSMFSNSGMELTGNPAAPINKIRLGQVHTLHYSSGKAATNIFWFEPNFHQANPFKHRKPDLLKRRFQWSLNKLSMCPYSPALTQSLLRYVRALDDKDHNSAAIRMWGALELLASPEDARYDRIVKRCSFLFDEVNYHRQVLEHLRDFRNRSVHSGDQSERAKTFCYQMQFYFSQLMSFHLAYAGDFRSIGQTNDFLDLPEDEKSLLERKTQLERALKFRRIET